MAFVKVVGGSEIYNFRIQNFVHFYSKIWSFSSSNTGTMTRCRPERRRTATLRAPTRRAARGRAFPMRRTPRLLGVFLRSRVPPPAPSASPSSCPLPHYFPQLSNHPYPFPRLHRPPHVACCPGRAIAVAGAEPLQPPQAALAVRPRRRLLRPNFGYPQALGERVVEPHYLPSRERRRLDGIRPEPPPPHAKDPISSPPFFPGSIPRTEGISVRF
jgi:hypothetical protein